MEVIISYGEINQSVNKKLIVVINYIIFQIVPVNMSKITINNEYEMIAFGRALGSFIGGDIVIGLSGALGAGKTTISKGISVGMGIMEPVTSPTYSLLNEYEGMGRKLYHVDLYRVNTTKEIDELELESLISPRTNMIIEWIEKLDAKWLENVIHITISYNNDDESGASRELQVEASSDELTHIIEEAIEKFEKNYKH